MTSKKQLQDIVAQIKKKAGPYTGSFAPDPDTGPGTGTGTRVQTTPATTTPPPAQTGGGGGGGGGGGRGTPGSYGVSPKIKEMQEKMKALSEKVQTEMNLGATTSSDPRAASEAEGRGSFSNFIARMLRGQGGYEYTPDPNKVKREDKGPMAQTRMNEVMATISRMGGPQAEKQPDGVWDFRTNNGLQNIRSFAQAMLTMANAFKLPIKSYSQQNVGELIIPRKETDISFQDKAESAPIISQHIDAISDMFDEITDGILHNPQYETYIEDDTPYATIAPPKTPTQPGQPDVGQQTSLLDAADAAEVSKIFPKFTFSFTGADGQQQTKDITIDKLITLQALKAWMKQNGVNVPIADITRQIRQQVSLPPRRYTPQQDEAWQQQQWKREQDAANRMRHPQPGGGARGNVNVRTSSSKR